MVSFYTLTNILSLWCANLLSLLICFYTFHLYTSSLNVLHCHNSIINSLAFATMIIAFHDVGRLLFTAMWSNHMFPDCGHLLCDIILRNTLGDTAIILISHFQKRSTHRYIAQFLWNCPYVNAVRPDWSFIYTGSRNEQQHEPMLIKFGDDIRRHQAAMS